MTPLKKPLVKKLALVPVALWRRFMRDPRMTVNTNSVAAPLYRWRLCFSGGSCTAALLLAGGLRFGA
jgi:hypothetical protein